MLARWFCLPLLALPARSAAAGEQATRARELNDLAIARLTRGEHGRAEKSARQARAVDERAWQPRVNLAVALMLRKEYVAARAELEVAEILNPASALSPYHLGRLHLLEGRMAESDSCFTRALDRDRKLYIALLFRAYVRQQLRRWVEARRDLEACASHSPARREADLARRMLADLSRAGLGLRPARRVGILLRFEQKPAPTFARTIQSEVERIFRPAGLELHWTPGEYDRIALVEMRGRCGFLEIQDNGPPPSQFGPLGWTVLHEGEVTPFAMVDCAEIARMVHRQAGQTFHRVSLQPIFWRLAARVLAHEMMHVLLKQREHQDGDCTRSHLRNYDLHVEARLTPEEVAALRNLSRDPAGPLLARDRIRPGSDQRPK